MQPPQHENVQTFSPIRIGTNPPEPIYAPYRPQQHFPNGLKSPPVINEVAEEDTLVIRRRQVNIFVITPVFNLMKLLNYSFIKLNTITKIIFWFVIIKTQTIKIKFSSV